MGILPVSEQNVFFEGPLSGPWYSKHKVSALQHQEEQVGSGRAGKSFQLLPSEEPLPAPLCCWHLLLLHPRPPWLPPANSHVRALTGPGAVLLCATASLVSASSVSVVVSADNVFGIWAMAKQRLKQPPRTSKLKHLLTIKMNWRLIKPFTSSLLFFASQSRRHGRILNILVLCSTRSKPLFYDAKYWHKLCIKWLASNCSPFSASSPVAGHNSGRVPKTFPSGLCMCYWQDIQVAGGISQPQRKGKLNSCA